MATLANNNMILNQYDVQELENTKSMTRGSMQFMSNASIQLYNVNHYHPSKTPSVRDLNGGISNAENLWSMYVRFTWQCEDELQCQVANTCMAEICLQ